MWTKPMSKGKHVESKYAYDSKLVYCIAKYNDEYNELTVKSFQKKFEKILTDINFEWKHKKKDGSLRIPSYHQILVNWFHLYDWEACSKAYAEDKIAPEKEQALLIYDKKYLKDTITDFKLIDSYYKRIKTLQGQERELGVDNTYRIAKLEETITSTWGRVRERLGLNKENADDFDDIIPVSDTPLHENPDLQDRWNEFFSELVEPRE